MSQTFDFAKTLELIKGGLLEPRATWERYLGENPPFMRTLMVLTGPLLLFNIVLSIILARITGGYAMYALHSNLFMALILGVVMAAIGVTVASFVVSFLAGTFGGKAGFDRGLAAVSLAAIPAWVIGPVGALVPWIGFLIVFASGILSMVFLYKIIPLALGVPEEKRVVHFIATLLTVFVVNLLVATVLGAGRVASVGAGAYTSSDRRISSGSVAPGVFGEVGRQGELIAAASQDTYDPPSDGKVDEDQVEDLVAVLRKARAVQEESAERFRRLSEEMEEKEKAGEKTSAADLVSAYQGMGSVMRANNAEMEIVKSGGGNWAEHEWVRAQLRAAKVQRGEGSEAIEHNYELYKEYEDELANL